MDCKRQQLRSLQLGGREWLRERPDVLKLACWMVFGIIMGYNRLAKDWCLDQNASFLSATSRVMTSYPCDGTTLQRSFHLMRNPFLLYCDLLWDSPRPIRWVQGQIIAIICRFLAVVFLPPAVYRRATPWLVVASRAIAPACLLAVSWQTGAAFGTLASPSELPGDSASVHSGDVHSAGPDDFYVVFSLRWYPLMDVAFNLIHPTSFIAEMVYGIFSAACMVFLGLPLPRLRPPQAFRRPQQLLNCSLSTAALLGIELLRARLLSESASRGHNPGPPRVKLRPEPGGSAAVSSGASSAKDTSGAGGSGSACGAAGGPGWMADPPEMAAPSEQGSGSGAGTGLRRRAGAVGTSGGGCAGLGLAPISPGAAVDQTTDVPAAPESTGRESAANAFPRPCAPTWPRYLPVGLEVGAAHHHYHRVQSATAASVEGSGAVQAAVGQPSAGSMTGAGRSEAPELALPTNGAVVAAAVGIGVVAMPKSVIGPASRTEGSGPNPDSGTDLAQPQGPGERVPAAAPSPAASLPPPSGRTVYDGAAAALPGTPGANGSRASSTRGRRRPRVVLVETCRSGGAGSTGSYWFSRASRPSSGIVARAISATGSGGSPGAAAAPSGNLGSPDAVETAPSDGGGEGLEIPVGSRSGDGGGSGSGGGVGTVTAAHSDPRNVGQRPNLDLPSDADRVPAVSSLTAASAGGEDGHLFRHSAEHVPYNGRTVLYSTRLKIEGYDPEDITPGYRERIAQLVAKSGLQLEGVVVRGGCIELVVETRSVDPPPGLPARPSLQQNQHLEQHAPGHLAAGQALPITASVNASSGSCALTQDHHRGATSPGPSEPEGPVVHLTSGDSTTSGWDDASSASSQHALGAATPPRPPPPVQGMGTACGEADAVSSAGTSAAAAVATLPQVLALSLAADSAATVPTSTVTTATAPTITTMAATPLEEVLDIGAVIRALQLREDSSLDAELALEGPDPADPRDGRELLPMRAPRAPSPGFMDNSGVEGWTWDLADRLDDDARYVADDDVWRGGAGYGAGGDGGGSSAAALPWPTRALAHSAPSSESAGQQALLLPYVLDVYPRVLYVGACCTSLRAGSVGGTRARQQQQQQHQPAEGLLPQGLAGASPPGDSPGAFAHIPTEATAPAAAPAPVPAVATSPSLAMLVSWVASPGLLVGGGAELSPLMTSHSWLPEGHRASPLPAVATAAGAAGTPGPWQSPLAAWANQDATLPPADVSDPEVSDPFQDTPSTFSTASSSEQFVPEAQIVLRSDGDAVVVAHMPPLLAVASPALVASDGGGLATTLAPVGGAPDEAATAIGAAGHRWVPGEQGRGMGGGGAGSGAPHSDAYPYPPGPPMDLDCADHLDLLDNRSLGNGVGGEGGGSSARGEGWLVSGNNVMGPAAEHDGSRGPVGHRYRNAALAAAAANLHAAADGAAAAGSASCVLGHEMLYCMGLDTVASQLRPGVLLVEAHPQLASHPDPDGAAAAAALAAHGQSVVPVLVVDDPRVAEELQLAADNWCGTVEELDNLLYDIGALLRLQDELATAIELTRRRGVAIAAADTVTVTATGSATADTSVSPGRSMVPSGAIAGMADEGADEAADVCSLAHRTSMLYMHLASYAEAVEWRAVGGWIEARQRAVTAAAAIAVGGSSAAALVEVLLPAAAGPVAEPPPEPLLGRASDSHEHVARAMGPDVTARVSPGAAVDQVGPVPQLPVTVTAWTTSAGSVEAPEAPVVVSAVTELPSGPGAAGIAQQAAEAVPEAGCDPSTSPGYSCSCNGHGSKPQDGALGDLSTALGKEPPVPVASQAQGSACAVKPGAKGSVRAMGSAADLPPSPRALSRSTPGLVVATGVEVTQPRYWGAAAASMRTLCSLLWAVLCSRDSDSGDAAAYREFFSGFAAGLMNVMQIFEIVAVISVIAQSGSVLQPDNACVLMAGATSIFMAGAWLVLPQSAWRRWSVRTKWPRHVSYTLGKVLVAFLGFPQPPATARHELSAGAFIAEGIVAPAAVLLSPMEALAVGLMRVPLSARMWVLAGAPYGMLAALLRALRVHGLSVVTTCAVHGYIRLSYEKQRRQGQQPRADAARGTGEGSVEAVGKGKQEAAGGCAVEGPEPTCHVGAVSAPSAHRR